MWPIIAGRRIALNYRWAQPDGVMELYQAGSEGPQWWVPYPDHDARPARAQHPRPLQCDEDVSRRSSSTSAPRRSGDCKLGPEWVGTSAKEDIPLPANVRRYYIASSPHGGGAGGFDTSLPSGGLAQADRVSRQQLGLRRCSPRTRCRTPRRSGR